jgi:hypothetical protein
MSYLNGPRLHFAGRFRVDVSTVNNYVTHFRNPDDPNDPGWNPRGSGSWRLSNCVVKRAVYADGSLAQTAAEDPVIGLPLGQIDSAVLVDLDPEQQMVSQIWGLQLQLSKPGTGASFKGAFKTTAFSDIWPNRAKVSGGGDFKMTAFFHSVLTGVAWGELLGSRLLSELKQASAADLLSIKFNVDGFDQVAHIGRIVGTIGPAHADEPAHFVAGRHCMGRFAGPMWFFPALVDAQRRKLVADFGNALQTTSVGGAFDPALDLEIGLLAGNGQFSSLGRVPIGQDGWYEQTAGVCEFPADRVLTAAELAQLASTPIGVRQRTGGTTAIVATEGADGVHVRAEDFVYRMSANETAKVTLRATRFGQSLPNAKIDLKMDLSQLQQDDGDPEVGKPGDGLGFPASVTTDANGVATLPLTARSIDNPRDYIDGQLYGVRYTASSSNPAAGAYVNRSNFVSVLVWTDYHAPSEPAWKQDVQPILSEYEKLYPVMKAIVDLNNYDSVVANKDRLQMVFSLPQEDPRYMPITRDLSPAKRQMMLDWLQTTGNAGRPNLDRTPGAPAVAAAAAEAHTLGPVARLGGKSAAYGRRRDHQD